MNEMIEAEPKPRLTAVTLGVRDFHVSLHFYEALGFARKLRSTGDEIAFLDAGGVVLALYRWDELAKDAALDSPPVPAGFRGTTLAWNCASRAAVNLAFVRALAAGARLAEPGEFTMRAFLNGRIDLTQAEAVRDLIESQTLYQAKIAAQQLDGALSHRLQPIKKTLVELIATLEAGIDFAEDDISIPPAAVIMDRIAAIRAPLEGLAKSFAYGKIVHEGLTLAIVGRPNVGKSSLFNRLVENERAIVTATPGTTRDLVTETVAIGGIPVHLVDTAGIRKALDEAESIGIRKSLEALADADLILIVLDLTQEITEEGRELLSHTKGRRAIIVENKSDLAAPKPDLAEDEFPRVRTSATTGDGIVELRAEILRHIRGNAAAQNETGFLTSARHQNYVNDSLAALQAASIAVQDSIPHEMLLLDLYSSLRPLDEITGATTTDDILNLIFSTFCIGK